MTIVDIPMNGFGARQPPTGIVNLTWGANESAAGCAITRPRGHTATGLPPRLGSVDPRGEVAQYRLLDTTRLYALEKLKSSGELKQIASRHAEYYHTLFAPADAESETRSQTEWSAVYGRHLDSVRAALDWAFSPEGDPQIGVALTVRLCLYGSSFAFRRVPRAG